MSDMLLENRRRARPGAVSEAPVTASSATPAEAYTRQNAPHITSGPMFESLDIVGFALATFIMLAPLAAYAVGWGL
jgi:hypothetical protein